MMYQVLRATAFVLLMGLAGPALACSIVYGSNWAFLSKAPQGWSSACGNQAMHGTSITLWPSGEKQDALDVMIYVTVSDQDPNGLVAFAKHDEDTFSSSPEKASYYVVQNSKKLSKYKHILVHYSKPTSGRSELVTYLAGPNVYYMIVLTADSASVLDRYKKSYVSYVNAFIPMVRK